MTRDEYLKNYEEKIKSEGGKIALTSKVQEVVFIKFIYNHMLKTQKPSLQSVPDYLIKLSEICSDAIHSEFEKTLGLKPQEILEYSKLAKELVKRGIEVKMKLEIVPQKLVNGDIHGWRVYAIFEADVDGMLVNYGERFKRKAGVFTPDGMFVFKYPPYNIRDESSPVGFVGVKAEDDKLIICDK